MNDRLTHASVVRANYKEMNIEEFQNKEEAVKAVDRIKKISFPLYKDGEDVDEFVKNISKIITTEFGYIFTPISPFKSKEFLSSFYRARKIESSVNLNLIREHSYPPINNTPKGRCNFPKFPVFYCSDNPMTAVLEIAKDSQDNKEKYCVSKWEFNSPNDTVMFENFLQTDLPEQNPYLTIRDGLKDKISSPFKISLNKELSETQEEGIIEHLKFLNSAFVNDNNYSLSATLAHRSLYANHNFRTDVLMYPSVQTQFKGVNLAMQPNFVENCLKMTRLYILNLNNYNSEKDTVEITISKLAIVEKNVIMWKEIKPNDKKYIKMINDDFGEMINGSFTENKNNLP